MMADTRRIRRTGGYMTGSHAVRNHVVRNFVDGEPVDPIDGRLRDLVDPVTGEVFAVAPVSGPMDVDLAMSAAARAFESWRDTTPAERQRAVLRIADAIEARTDELVAVECQNTGKPVA